MKNGELYTSTISHFLSVIQCNLDYPNMLGPGKNVRIIESSDNRGWLYINAIMRVPRRSVWIIECSDNRSSDNRGFTVYRCQASSSNACSHTHTIGARLSELM